MRERAEMFQLLREWSNLIMIRKHQGIHFLGWVVSIGAAAVMLQWSPGISYVAYAFAVFGLLVLVGLGQWMWLVRRPGYANRKPLFAYWILEFCEVYFGAPILSILFVLQWKDLIRGWWLVALYFGSIPLVMLGVHFCQYLKKQLAYKYAGQANAC